MPVTATAKTPTGRRRATRKTRRRLEREAKKAKRAACQRGGGRNKGRAAPSSQPTGRGNTEAPLEAHQGAAGAHRSKSTATKEEDGGLKRPVRQLRLRHEREKKGRRRQQPLLAAEEREVSRLEKKLKMKKRKTLPAAFREDGLDYLLNLTDQFGDHGNRESCEEGTESGMSSGEEPLETETRSHRARERAYNTETENEAHVKKKKIDDKTVVATAGNRVWFGVEEKEDSESDKGNSGDSCEDGDSGEDDESGEDDGSEKEESECEVEEERESDVSEARDSTEGHSEGREEERVEGERGGRYVPPHMRGLEENLKRTPRMEKLQRTIQGLVNRLNESNLQSIATQLEQMYNENSRNDMNHCLTEVLLKACVSPALISERFAMLHVMLVAILHNNIGSEVGAYMIQKLAQRLDGLLSLPPNYGRGKECDCLLLLIAHLYTFKVLHCVLIYDIIRKLAGNFTERDIELLLLLLKNTGMEIRKDDATSLKDIILLIQSQTASSTSVRDSSRTRFMLETINALKTNNSRKIPNHDPSLLEHMRRLLRGLVHSRGPSDENQLKITLQDLLMADQQGRWWVVGSAWSGREADNPPADTASGEGVSSTESWVLDLARKQRMNTDVRKNIFSVLMTSEDCVDAFEKLLRLGLKEKQEREIIHVIIECCLQEKTFNPFYAVLGQKFCEYSRAHQVTFQYSVWDRLKTLSDMTSFGRSHLCQLLVHLVATRALSLAVLRVVEFTQIGRVDVKFYRKLLHTLLQKCTEDTCKAVFSRLAAQPHLKPFQDSLLVFMKHHLPLPHPSPRTIEGALQTKLRLIEHIMSSPHTVI